MRLFQIGGLYKGMSFPLMSSGALNALFFGVYANALRFLEHQQNADFGRRTFSDENYSKKNLSKDNWHVNVFAAGCIGGVFACFLACPIDLIKIQMQSQTGKLSELLNSARYKLNFMFQHTYSHTNRPTSGIVEPLTPFLCLIRSFLGTGVSSSKAWGHHNEPQHKGVLDCIRRLYVTHGIKGLYTGMHPMLLR